VKLKRMSLLLILVAGFLAAGTFVVTSPGSLLGVSPAATAEPYPDAHKETSDESAVMSVPGSPNTLTHPCGLFNPEPPFMGLSPLSFAVAYNGPTPYCGGAYGDPAVWRHNGHDYIASAYFSSIGRFHIWNVDDPYNPVHIRTQDIPGGGSTITLFDFVQNGQQYLSMSTRGSNSGWHVYNVTDPANPAHVVTKTGADWAIVHEHFVSLDGAGNADYAWLAMSGESGSGNKMVVLNLANLNNPVETNRFQGPSSFIHDITVIGQRVFVAHWLGGLYIFDKTTLATVPNPTPLNPPGSIQPSGFQIHHSWPTSDGNYVFIEDEFLNSSSAEKVKYYDITNIAAPVYRGGIIGNGIAATQQAHNLKIFNLGPGLDQLFIAWYKAGSRGYLVNTSVPGTITVTENIRHEYRDPIGNPGFGGAWGMDYWPCTLRGQPHLCVVTADYERHGMIIDALGVHPELDPYAPDLPVVTSSSTFNSCSVTITGTAHDYWSGVSLVEVSINGGPWMPATGTDNWTLNWTAPSNGTYSVVVRVTDNGQPANTRSTAPFDITVSGCSGDLTPTVPVPSNTPVPPSSTAVPPSSTPIPSTPVATATCACVTMTPTPQTEPSETAVVTPTACTITFTDVPPSHTFYQAIRCVACRGVISGYADGTFRPGNDATRGQISKMVSNAAGYNDPPGAPMFEDVAPTDTFYAFINRLAMRGHISGYACGGAGEPCGPNNLPYFRPGANASRGQMAKILSNAAGYNDDVITVTYADVPTTHTFYLFIERITMHGVAGGYPCGGTGEPCDPMNRPYFRAERNITRGQLAQIIQRGFFPSCVTR
jgi:hypothetical protein